jgi:hypothetical protein
MLLCQLRQRLCSRDLELLLIELEAPLERLVAVHLPVPTGEQHPVADERLGLPLGHRPVDVDMDEADVLLAAPLGLDRPLAPLGDGLDVVVGDLDRVDDERLADVLLSRDRHLVGLFLVEVCQFSGQCQPTCFNTVGLVDISLVKTVWAFMCFPHRGQSS